MAKGYFNKELTPGDNDSTFKAVDLIFSGDSSQQLFYLATVGVISESSDGALSEYISYRIWEFLKRYPGIFSCYISRSNGFITKEAKSLFLDFLCFQIEVAAKDSARDHDDVVNEYLDAGKAYESELIGDLASHCP